MVSMVPQAYQMALVDLGSRHGMPDCHERCPFKGIYVPLASSLSVIAVIVQGDFKLTLFEDGILPAAFMVSTVSMH